MATSKVDIYSRAVKAFDDPRITSAFESNPIEWMEIMSGYLDMAIPLFITPTMMIPILNDITSSSEQTELFDGTGATDTFILTTIPPTDSYFQGTISNINYDLTYTQITNSVTFLFNPPIGTDNVATTWYFAGQFNQTLTDRQQNILAKLLVQCWAEKERNFMLDIRRLLNDNDFKMGVEATNVNAKSNWFASTREYCDNEMNKYSWDVYNETLRTQYGLPPLGGIL